jgi:DNA-3-methyladenine glycosylase I
MAHNQPPPRGIPADDDAYFELLSKAVFLAGFRWSVVEAKWPHIRAAFGDFHVATVAAYGPPDVDRLMADAGVIRNLRKIEGTIGNAQALQTLAADHGSVRNWLATNRGLPWPERRKAVSRPFQFVGDFGAYFFLWSAGEPVPPHEERDSWTGPLPPGAPEHMG